jgi:hypothetical protein
MYRETARIDASLGADAAYRTGLDLAEKIQRAGGESLLAEILYGT